MYLLYVDESGAPDSDYFVAGAVLVHEQDAYTLAGRLDTAMRRLGPDWPSRELHAQLVRTGKGAWRRLPKPLREDFTATVARLLTSSLPTTRRSPTLFAVAVDRASFPAIDPIERAYEELFLRVDSYLGRLHAGGDSHRCIAISDETRLEERLQLLMQAWRTTQGRVRRLSAFAEVPLFADSKATRLLQFADFVAHWVYRSYESSDSAIRGVLMPAFDIEGGVVHGLVHLCSGRSTCPCPACVSRRGRR